MPDGFMDEMECVSVFTTLCNNKYSSFLSRPAESYLFRNFTSLFLFKVSGGG